jgi:hypothetical protein
MSTIHLHQTTTSTPEQYIAGLTDFGPGRSKLFGNSAKDYLKVHHRGHSLADASGHTYTFTRRPDGRTDIDVVVVRDGKNFKGWVLGLVLGTIGKRVLRSAFENSVKAIEVRNGSSKHREIVTGIWPNAPA